MAMGASPASGDCQRALNELVMEIYRVFDELDAPFLLKKPDVLQAALKIRRIFQTTLEAKIAWLAKLSTRTTRM